MPQLPSKAFLLSFDVDRRIDEAFRTLIHEPWGRTIERGWCPAADVYDLPEAYVVVIDAPGVLAADLQVRVDDHAVTIAGQREMQRLFKNAQALWAERKLGQFERRLRLDELVDPRGVEVSFDRGQCIIRLPKLKTSTRDTHTSGAQ